MNVAPVPPQITSISEGPVKKQWFEEQVQVAPETTTSIGIEQIQSQPNAEPPSVPDTLTTIATPLPLDKAVVNKAAGLDAQKITTLVGADPVTTQADHEENEVITAINTAHGTK
jgi:hypothetical protein